MFLKTYILKGMKWLRLTDLRVSEHTDLKILSLFGIFIQFNFHYWKWIMNEVRSNE